MIFKSRGVVLKLTRHSENSAIVNIFTEQHGLMGFHIASYSKGKGAVRPSHLIPLNTVELVYRFEPVKNLNRIRDIQCSPVLHHIHINPVKRGIAMVILDVLNKCIQGNEENKSLFALLHREIIILENLQSEFSLPWFLIQFAIQSGCSPAFETYKTGCVFDTESGLFIESAHQNSGTVSGSEMIYSLWAQKGKSYGNFSDAVRAITTDMLIEHLSHHLNSNLSTDTVQMLRSIMKY